MKLRRSAFTLIELVVVIAIIAIMGAVAPFITSGAIIDRQMYNTAAQLQQDLMLVQNQAITYSSGGPLAGGTRFVMRLYLNSNAFAYQTTESGASPSGSNPTLDIAGIVVRQMPSTFGFPAFFSNPSSLVSVKIDASPSVPDVTSGYVDVVFDNQGLAYWAVNRTVDGPAFQQATGSIAVMLTNSSSSKQIQVTISPIGRMSIAWVPGKR